MPLKRDILWLQGVTCNADAHSFLNHPNLASVLKNFRLSYHPLLPSRYTLQEVADKHARCDILIFEGAYGKTLRRADRSVETLFAHYSAQAEHIVALGTCASYGGIMAQSDAGESGLLFNKRQKIDTIIQDPRKLINIPGCPIHPEWLGFVLQSIAAGAPIALDSEYRPIELFSSLAHHGCDRNEYFEWKVDANGFGQKEGCLFYEQGCRAPMTRSICNKLLWNENSSKTRAGTPCLGCTESSFPRDRMFRTKTNMSIPEDVPLGISKKAYLTLAGVAKTFHIKRLEGRLIDYKEAYRKD